MAVFWQAGKPVLRRSASTVHCLTGWKARPTAVRRPRSAVWFVDSFPIRWRFSPPTGRKARPTAICHPPAVRRPRSAVWFVDSFPYSLTVLSPWRFSPPTGRKARPTAICHPPAVRGLRSRFPIR